MTSKSINKTISYITAGLVFLVALGAFALSYNALRQMAAANGITGWQSHIWPLLIDFSLVVFSLAVVRASLHGERTIWPWSLVGLYTVATVIFNILHAPNDTIAQIMAAVAPVSLFLSFETLMSHLKIEVSRHGVTTSLDQMNQVVSDRQNELVKLDAAIAQRMSRIETLQAQISQMNRSISANDTASDEPTSQTDEQRAAHLNQANDTRQAQVEARREQVLDMLGQGMSQADMVKATGKSLSTIRRDVAALNGRAEAVTK